MRARLALVALAVFCCLQLGAAARNLQSGTKKICKFKADKDYSTKDFAKAFSLHWDYILELNKDWCGDHHIAHVPKGSLWNIPCDAHHAHIDHWHWKAESKRHWKGDACMYKLDKDQHPRWIVFVFEADYDICLELNPWIDSRDKCEREEIVWLPCEKKHKEKKENWHHTKERIVCDFTKPKPPPKKCSYHCPGHYPKWWDKPQYKKHDWDYKYEPDWMHPDKPYWPDYGSDYEYAPKCCHKDPYCSDLCSDHYPEPDYGEDVPECCHYNPKCDERCPETNPDESPADESPADESPADESPADESPADESPADESPADESPADESPADESPADESPADESPADESPADESPDGGDDPTDGGDDPTDP